MLRTDGQGLLYDGLVHSLHGESESGKSMVAQAEMARSLNAGERVLYVDFESDAHAITNRLLAMGARGESLSLLDYVRPDDSPDSSQREYEAFESLLRERYAFVVIDGVTDALGVFHFGTKDNDDITTWMRKFPRRIAQDTGAAVVLIDHVTKATDDRGRFAIGAQAKLSGLTGAAYSVEIAEPLAVGLRGEIVLRVAKDRPGGVRGHCGDFQKKTRMQEAARVVVDSTEPGRIEITFQPPSEGSGLWEPTEIMQALSQAIEEAPRLSQRALREEVGAKRDTVNLALELLVSRGYIKQEKGRGGAYAYVPIKPYRKPDRDEIKRGTLSAPF